MEEYDFNQTESMNRKKLKVTKFREHFTEDKQRDHMKKKHNRKQKRLKGQDIDWPLS